MILEEEAFEKFGYYPGALSRMSHKRILAKCDDCGKIREIGKNQYCSLCRSCSQKAESNPNWKGGEVKRICTSCGKTFAVKPSVTKRKRGKYCSKKCRDFACRNRVKRVCTSCGKTFEVRLSVIKGGNGKYCSQSCAAKVSIKKQRRNAHPQKTQPEQIFEEICKKNNIPFRFVGDGSLWLGNANPDFLHNTRKLVCEIFGDYWHSPLSNKNISTVQTLEGRKVQLKAEGYKLIVIWETDLKRKDAEAFVLYTLEKHNIFPSTTQ